MATFNLIPCNHGKIKEVVLMKVLWLPIALPIVKKAAQILKGPYKNEYYVCWMSIETHQNLVSQCAGGKGKDYRGKLHGDQTHHDRQYSEESGDDPQSKTWLCLLETTELWQKAKKKRMEHYM